MMIKSLVWSVSLVSLVWTTHATIYFFYPTPAPIFQLSLFPSGEKIYYLCIQSDTFVGYFEGSLQKEYWKDEE